MRTPEPTAWPVHTPPHADAAMTSPLPARTTREAALTLSRLSPTCGALHPPPPVALPQHRPPIHGVGVSKDARRVAQ